MCSEKRLVCPYCNSYFYSPYDAYVAYDHFICDGSLEPGQLKHTYMIRRVPGKGWCAHCKVREEQIRKDKADRERKRRQQKRNKETEDLRRKREHDNIFGTKNGVPQQNEQQEREQQERDEWAAIMQQIHLEMAQDLQKAEKIHRETIRKANEARDRENRENRRKAEQKAKDVAKAEEKRRKEGRKTLAESSKSSSSKSKSKHPSSSSASLQPGPAQPMQLPLRPGTNQQPDGRRRYA